MVLAVDYLTSSAMLQAATSKTTLDLVETFLDSPNIELFSKGQCFFKEGSGPSPDAKPNPDSYLKEGVSEAGSIGGEGLGDGKSSFDTGDTSVMRCT